MANYKCDHQDVFFNLFDVLKIDQIEKYGLDKPSIKEILSEYDKFIENEIYPTRVKSDVEGVKLTETGVKVPEFLHAPTKMFYEMGWFALGLPEDIGGTPVPEAMAAVCRSLNMAANTGWSAYPGLTKSAMNVMRLRGDDFVKSTFIQPIMEGRWGGTMCLTEAGAGSDVGNLKTTAKPIEAKEGWYQIKGTKIFITSGDSDLYENNIHLVLARTPNAPEGTKGISLFLVPREKLDGSGNNDVICSGIEHKMCLHISATAVLNFGENDKCEGYLLGKEFDGMKNMFIMMNEARLDCGMQGEAQANLAYEMSKQYVNERVQFGTEIINHPDVKKMMLKMRAVSRGLRSLMLYTADLFDKAHEDKKWQSYIELLTPICKSYGSEQGFNIAVDAVQAHGGYGYCHEYGIEQFVRDTKIATIYEGTNGIQAIDFVMRKILKDEGKTLGHVVNDIKNAVAKLPQGYEAEKLIFENSLSAAQEAIGHISKCAASKQMNLVLQSCKDFLDLSGHLIVAWRLMESALISDTRLKKSEFEGDQEKHFLETKIVDFKIYTSQYLPIVSAYKDSITNAKEDMTTFNL